ncbi:MAG: hypothetical protein IJW73_03195 [Candidatus Gastranaerophilales bacterium]|nr:hypothetical protein [Candidatus Gastranaerophilales bacterium]
MYDNEYFVVDMVSCATTGEIINSLSLALETLNHSGKKIVLKLNDGYLNQSQLLSMQSLITSYGCLLDTVETVNEDTARVAENMNIYVQKPIEKRVEDKYENDHSDNFKPFSMEPEQRNDNSIALKEVNGLHFEADLDAIQHHQDNINFENDMNKVGINLNADFNAIDEQISNHYSFDNQPAPTEQPEVQEQNNYSEFHNDIQENNHEYPNYQPDYKQEYHAEQPHNEYHTEYKQEFQPEIQEQYKSGELEDFLNHKDDFGNAERNSIGVYKKAYDENQEQEQEWEDVNFYETPTNDPVVSDTKNTTYINQTLRSGQVLEADGNVVIIGDCHPGSEVRALGDITVWGVLSGIAHAGCKGNINAKVRALKMNAVQLRIGNCYSRRPDGTNIPYILRSTIFTPEEARVIDGEIMLFKINQN